MKPGDQIILQDPRFGITLVKTRAGNYAVETGLIRKEFNIYGPAKRYYVRGCSDAHARQYLPHAERSARK